MASKAFYTLELDNQAFGFKRPTIAQLDRYAAQLSRAPISASLDFCMELVDNTEAWGQLVQDRPGLAVRVASAITEAMGFTV